MSLRFEGSCVFAIVLCIAVPSGALELQFRVEGAVGLCCFRPGDDALFFGVVWQEQPWVGRITTVREIETVLAGDDTAWHEPICGVPHESYWIGADLSTGDYVLASRTSDTIEEKTIPPENLVRDFQFRIVGFSVESSYLETVVIRPGIGAWAFSAGDGSVFDGDGQNNESVQVDIQQFSSIGNSPAAPSNLIRGDVVLALDTWRGILFATVVNN